MANQFKTNLLVLSKQTLSATGSNLYLNGLLIGSGTYSSLDALTNSGIILINDINSLSGWAASSINLTSTGQTLYNYIIATSGLATGISGNLSITGVALLSAIQNTGQQAWSAAQNNGINLSGNLGVTGSNLYFDITGFSGLSTQINVLVTGISFNFNLSTSINYFYTWTGIINSTGILPSLSVASGYSYTIKNKATGYQLLISGNIDNMQNFIVYPLDSYTFKSDNETWNII